MVNTIPGFQSLCECCQSIKKTADTIARSHVSSTIVNSMRISSLRSLIDLFERYNNLMIAENNFREGHSDSIPDISKY